MKNRLPMERRCCSNAAIPGRRKEKAGHILTSAGDSANEVERCLHC